MPSNLPQFDPAKLAFPSDAITLGQMRKRDPSLFAGNNLARIGRDADAMAVYGIEYVLASKAFAKRIGRDQPFPFADREEHVDTLNDAYIEYGISTGMQQTKQLIRDLERAAEQQAKTLAP